MLQQHLAVTVVKRGCREHLPHAEIRAPRACVCRRASHWSSQTMTSWDRRKPYGTQRTFALQLSTLLSNDTPWSGLILCCYKHMPVIMPPFSGHPSTFIGVHSVRQVEKGSVKPKTKSIAGLLNRIKSHERCHPEKKVKHADAGLKIGGLGGNMEDCNAFICKIQSSGVLASLCVACCFCKHMNKNKNGQENGVYLAHAYSNGVRDAVLTLPLSG